LLAWQRPSKVLYVPCPNKNAKSNARAASVSRHTVERTPKTSRGAINFTSKGWIMDNQQEISTSRKHIAIRLLYTLLYLIVLEMLKAMIQLSVIFQFIYLLIIGKHSEPVRKFTNKLSTYTYKVMRYLTLNENLRPFPFSDFPDEMEQSETPVVFTNKD
jgi:hypothetical protein